MISALGRPFALGMLYDRRSEKLIPGKKLWSADHLNHALSTVPMASTTSEVFTESTIEDKMKAVDIKGDLKLSFLSGLVSVEGAANYLNDVKMSKQQPRVVLKYEAITDLKQLKQEHLGAEEIQYPEVFDCDIATDVVAGILYGATAFMVFDKDVSKDESVQQMQANMEMLVKSIPGLFVDEHGSVDMTEEQKKIAENMTCKMYGDFEVEKSPINYEDAVKVYKQLPSLIGENGERAVPIGVYLCPLSNIDKKCQQMVREISADLFRKIIPIQEQIQSITTECNDLVKEQVCALFPRLRRQLKSFTNFAELYQISFQRKVLSVLPQIRSGMVEEITLAEIIDENDSSPFSFNAMKRWTEDRRNEIKRLQGIVNSLKGTAVVDPETVENELYNPANEHIVCCMFKIGCEEDDQILKMDAYVNENNDSKQTAANCALKVDQKVTYKKVRETLRHFMTLMTANEENNSVNFLAVDKPLSRDFSGNTGAFLYLYEDGELDNEDLISYPRPTNLKVEELTESILQLSWHNSAGNNVSGYKVQYKIEDQWDTWTSTDISSSDGERQMATLTSLEPATKYIIRVCSFLKIIVSGYSDVLTATTKPASAPGRPEIIEAACNSLTVSFSMPEHLGKDIQIVSYKVEYSSDNWNTRKVQHTKDAALTYTLKHLQPSTSYIMKVTASCGHDGESNASPSSEVFSTFSQATVFQPTTILGLCEIIEPPEDGKPAVYALPLTLVFEDCTCQLRKYEIHFYSGEKVAPLSNTTDKVIMMVGSTGSGKTTTVNAMINHILGVKWEDPFRLKLIHENSSNQGSDNIGNQTCSQTQFVTCYTLPHMRGFKVPYTLTIVDTPGFGDTRGIKQDEKITEQIRTFFNTSGTEGIDHIDAICFLAQAGIPRLTHTQRYVFDRILSMFGRDIQNNISVLFTFADGQKPQALSALCEAGILNEAGVYFKFNNSALFADNSEHNADEKFDKMFWTMGVKSFEKYFKSLNANESRSLVLTKEVLQERAQLEVRVSGLQDKINSGINTLSRFQQEQRIFNQHAVDINANRNFKYTVNEERRVKVPLQTGTFVTNCTTCNYTCHYPCSIPRSEDKESCAAMTNGNCHECPNSCHWSRHVNDQYRMETEYVQVEKEYDSKKTLYQKAVEGQTNVEALISQLKDEFNDTQNSVLTFVAEMQRGLQRLSEIALKKDPLQQVDYLNLLIQSEEMQGRPGFMERIRSLKETRDRAEQINKMTRPDYDPWEAYRENEETRKFLQDNYRRQNRGIVRRIANAVANVFT